MAEVRDPASEIGAAELAAGAGDFTSAEQHLSRAVELEEVSFGPMHAELASILNNLGVVYERLDRPEKAEGCYRRAYAIAKASLPPGDPGIELSAKGRTALRELVADGNTRQKIVKRARIVLMSAEGHGTVAIMRAVGVAKTTVWRWQEYFAEAGVAGLVKGRSKPPGKKPIAAEVKLKVVEKTVKERPANATHWSVRLMAAEMGISHTSVQRIWHEYGLKPHLVRGFKVSNDPDFVAKVKDVVGLYLDPPELSTGPNPACP
jgi:Transposase and inactivated derivatives